MNKQSIVDFTNTGPTIEIGKFTIRFLADGTIWMQCVRGEGMQVNADILEKELDEMFWRLF